MASKLPSYDDLMQASRADLMQLTADLERAMRDSEQEVRKDTLEELRRVAKENGFELADFTTAPTGRGSKGKATGEAKFRHPENPEVVWSGRGRQPEWVKAHIEAGGTKEDLAI